MRISCDSDKPCTIIPTAYTYHYNSYVFTHQSRNHYNNFSQRMHKNHYFHFHPLLFFVFCFTLQLAVLYFLDYNFCAHRKTSNSLILLGFMKLRYKITTEAAQHWPCQKKGKNEARLVIILAREQKAPSIPVSSPSNPGAVANARPRRMSCCAEPCRDRPSLGNAWTA